MANVSFRSLFLNVCIITVLFFFQLFFSVFFKSQSLLNLSYTEYKNDATDCKTFASVVISNGALLDKPHPS